MSVREGLTEAYLILYDLENSLRVLIINELDSISDDWWEQRIPGDIKVNCEQRKEKERLPWLDEKEQHPIFYADFADYQKIITQKTNWKEVFKKTFVDKEAISTKLRELNPIRNNIAHNRPLSSNEVETLRLYSKHILACIEKSEKWITPEIEEPSIDLVRVPEEQQDVMIWLRIIDIIKQKEKKGEEVTFTTLLYICQLRHDLARYHLSLLQKKGCISWIEGEGYKLTDKGKEIYDHLSNIYKLFWEELQKAVIINHIK